MLIEIFNFEDIKSCQLEKLAQNFVQIARHLIVYEKDNQYHNLETIDKTPQELNEEGKEGRAKD